MATGHNADDMAEKVLLNILRGDTARLGRCTAIVTGQDSSLPRVKPFKYTYEKEIVMYAYFKRLDYFSTECIYAPFAARGFAREFVKDLELYAYVKRHDYLSTDCYLVFLFRCFAARGFAREFVKDLESARPSAILDVIRSAEDFRLGEVAQGRLPPPRLCTQLPAPSQKRRTRKPQPNLLLARNRWLGAACLPPPEAQGRLPSPGLCSRCKYISSQELCKACLLLEGLNKGLPGLGVVRPRGGGRPPQDTKGGTKTEPLQLVKTTAEVAESSSGASQGGSDQQTAEAGTNSESVSAGGVTDLPSGSGQSGCGGAGGEDAGIVPPGGGGPGRVDAENGGSVSNAAVAAADSVSAPFNSSVSATAGAAVVAAAVLAV
eukprot:gene3011-13032_t